jgi:hypothetical protein
MGETYCPVCIKEKYLRDERQRVLALLTNQMTLHQGDHRIVATLTALKEALEQFP